MWKSVAWTVSIQKLKSPARMFNRAPISAKGLLAIAVSQSGQSPDLRLPIEQLRAQYDESRKRLEKRFIDKVEKPTTVVVRYLVGLCDLVSSQRPACRALLQHRPTVALPGGSPRGG